MTIKEKLERAREDIAIVYGSGVDKGRDIQEAEFWEEYQAGGTRTNYKMAFAGTGWTEKNFYPRYNIIAKTMQSAFDSFGFKGSLKDRLEEMGVELILDNYSMSSFFSNASGITELPHLDMSSVTYTMSTFQNMTSLKSLSITLPDARSVNWSSTFKGLTALESLTLIGKIYTRTTNAVDLSWSKKLSKESIEGLIEALDESVSGQYVTISQTAVNNAFETGEGEGDGSSSPAWEALIATRPNWTINLLDS